MPGAPTGGAPAATAPGMVAPGAGEPGAGDRPVLRAMQRTLDAMRRARVIRSADSQEVVTAP
ncbi:hypothetical protein GCM10009573_14540 [Agromyces bracchium]